MKGKSLNNKDYFFKNVLILLFSQIIVKVVGLVYKLYLTNKEGFGDSGNAIYSSGFQIYALLLTLSSTGVPNAIAKLVSERLAIGDTKGAHNIFKISFVTFAILGSIGTIFLFMGANFIANVCLEIPEAEYTLIALSPSILFVAISSVIKGYFNGMQNMKATANSQTIEQIFKTLLTIILVEIVSKISFNNTILMAAGANLATTMATFLGFAYLYKYYIERRKEIASEVKASTNNLPIRIRKTIKNILSVAMPISLSSIMSSFNRNIDSFTIVRILKKYINESEAKIQYGILSGKVDILIMLPTAFNIAFITPLVPEISSLTAKGNFEQVNKKINFALLITILIGLPSTIGMYIFAEPILAILFPNATQGYKLLQLSSFIVIFTLVLQTINASLQGLGKNIVPAIALGVGMICKLFCNIILINIEKIGINGAIIGNIMCNLVACIIGFHELNKNMKIKINIIKIIFKPIIATFIMSICSYSLYYRLKGIVFEKMATILAIVFAIIIYVISILILKVFSKEQIESLNIFKKLKNI